MKLVAPLAPHLSEELWQRLGHAESIAGETWPAAEERWLIEEQVEISVQVKGKMRARVKVPADADEDTAREIALADPAVQRHVGERTLRRVIYVPGRLINIVTS